MLGLPCDILYALRPPTVPPMASPIGPATNPPKN